jgi:hypothetical protein
MQAGRLHHDVQLGDDREDVPLAARAMTHDSEISRFAEFIPSAMTRRRVNAMHRPINTRRQELVLEGRWHFPIALFNLKRFRRWYSDRCPRSIKASYNPLGRYAYRLLHRKSESP